MQDAEAPAVGAHLDGTLERAWAGLGFLTWEQGGARWGQSSLRMGHAPPQALCQQPLSDSHCLCHWAELWV